ncbi:MAG: class I mannose-6-phosphate isomerase, partial [Oscillospiraceae bacterium]|nr:class I mannose-6-phosphate isomerase [Oscillospiraceae bacterium]
MNAFLLSPYLKEILWGGDKLKNKYNYKTGLANIAEAWVLSCHEEGMSQVITGKYKGLPLLDALNIKNPSDFPILIKFIDAKENLSVQVHPGGGYAGLQKGESGKTECWYILDAEDGAEIVCGFKEKFSKDEFLAKVKGGSLSGCLNTARVKAGDVVFIPPGTLHAIGGGIMLAEVQQNSNATYR